MEGKDVTAGRKLIRKNDRRQRKCQHVLEREANVTCSATPTKNIAICNAGLVNGLAEEVVAENFIKFGALERIIMLPGKSYCFVVYNDISCAINAFKQCNGILRIGQNNKPIYLVYTNDLPTENKKYNFADVPPGLILLDEFISEEEELLLLSLNDFENFSEPMKFRKVKHFGYEFLYGINNVNKNNPLQESIPSECDFLWRRLSEKYPEFKYFKPDQLTVNHYLPGQGIPSHVDTHSAFEDPIMSLSLGSDVVMEFDNDDIHLSVLLPRRSLLIMSGESRYNYTHGITPRKLDVVPAPNGLSVQNRGTRVSFTFRKIRRGDCTCPYTSKCNSFLENRKKSGVEDPSSAARLEDTHVHDVYENVALHFSETRSKPWPNVLKFVNSLEAGSVLVDVGCGNGKYLGENNNIYDIGCDRSRCLLDICKSRNYEVFLCNCLEIPIKDAWVDAAISIAVIHHLASEERRLQAVDEIVRILRTGGKALIYVWAKEQIRNNEKSSYIMQDRQNRKNYSHEDENCQFVKLENDISLPMHTNRKDFRHQDVLVPWKLKAEGTQANEASGNQFLRFYHVFREGELEKLCSMNADVIIESSYYDQGNWCVIIKKIK